MFHRNDTVLRNGLGVVGASVTVYVNGTDAAGDYAGATKAVLFSDKDGLHPILNPVTTDPNGEFSYFIANGIYDEIVKYGSITDTNTYIQMFDQAGGEAVVATAAAVAARDEAVAAAASATSSKNTTTTKAAESEASAAAADESASTAVAARGEAIAASIEARSQANTATDAASAALDAQTEAEAAALGTSSFDFAINFAGNGDVYIPARVAMTLDQGNAVLGTGVLAYSKSTAAAPAVFNATALPVTLEAGAWLKVSLSGIVGSFFATHLKRTA